MLSRRARTLSGVVVLAVTFTGLALTYGLNKLPGMPEAPDAPVVGVPAGSLAHKPRTPYRGKHPRNQPRPAETFHFPITPGQTGPVETLFSGAPSYPFFCGKNSVNGLQPLVDNQNKEGVPVFSITKDGKKTTEVIGYSRDCSHPTTVSYFYLSVTDGKFYPLQQANGDIDTVVVNGKSIDFIVRLETGTINRFFYAIAALRGHHETADAPSASNWNRRLLYQFRGGVGVGRRQGNISTGDILTRRQQQLAQGYAIVYSTANQTKNHYNIWLAEDTARRLKKQFIALYGKPLYSIGIGGSGGAIQQYLLAQNAPGVLDAAIALYSYPDMVSQTIYVFDCEPLEYYFDVLDQENPRWQNATERSTVIGLAASASIDNRFKLLETVASLFDSRYRRKLKGTGECVAAWRGLAPLVNNPNFVHFENNFSKEIAANTHWSHWEDLRDFYGAGNSGYANSVWDNEGVQYGLEALKKGHLSVANFLKLNASIGGWKPAKDQQNEKLWFLNGSIFPVEFSVWSDHNLNLGNLDKPAPRSLASIEAIEGIYRSGHVFLGDVEIPIIDLRHYLDNELDMHHSFASFTSRERIKAARGHADNQLIWVSHKGYAPYDEALNTLDLWLQRIIDHPERGVAANRPQSASDQCFDSSGNILAAGENVWDGQWNNKSTGRCMQQYPIHRTSRQAAGGPITDDIFKCALQPVEHALAKGTYGIHTAGIAQSLSQMQRIFPNGVCNYERPDQGRPRNRLIKTNAPVTIAGQVIATDYRSTVKQEHDKLSTKQPKHPLQATTNKISRN